ncbi:MAG: NAD(+) synthase, partial [Spirochaetales bacterium]|nr:NAD(+) synthase [Candidatus Physcosoma equi]
MRDGFVKVAAVSPSLKVGNPVYNADEIICLMEEAQKKGVKVLVFPELSITGYTCGDLFFQRSLQDAAEEALLRIVEASENTDMLTFVGYPLPFGGKLYNTAAAIQDGRILAFIAKKNLPNYNEFYEARWFTPCPEENTILETDEGDILFGNKIILQANLPQSLRIGCEICEDLW